MSRVDDELLSAFNAIDPSRLEYDEWFTVSAVMHDEGLSEAEWDAWNRRDHKRYTERVNSRKWASIRGDGKATRKTVFMHAYEQGWSWHGKGSKSRFYGWDDEIVLGQTITDDPATTGAATDSAADKSDAKKDEPPKLENLGEPEQIHELASDMEPAEMMRRQLACMFRIGEKVSVALSDQTRWNSERKKWEPLAGNVYDAAGLSHGNNPNGIFAKVNPAAGAWVRLNPTTGSKIENVTRFATALIESDDIDRESQLELYRKLHLPIRCVVDSAGKSMHAFCIIDAESEAEYRQRTDWLRTFCDVNGLPTDHSNINPNCYARLAGATRGDNIQRLVCEAMGPQSWGEFRARIAELAAGTDADEGAEDEDDRGPRIEFMDLGDIVEDPIEPPDEIICGLLPRERIAQLTARGGSGKTFLGYEAGLCVASGRQWLRFDCRRGRALYIDPELHIADIRRRVQSIAQGMGIRSEDIAGRFEVVSLRGTTATADVLDDAIRRRTAETGKRYDLIIIDSINAILTGDENSSVDVRAFIASLQRLTKDTGAACLIFHHAGKGGGRASGELARGSSVFLDGPDECIEVMELKVEEGSAADELLKAHHKTKPNGEMIYATAWRMTFPKHRTGAPIKPIDMIFRYPLHLVDHTGELAECKVAGSSADYGASGGSRKGESFVQTYDEMNDLLRGIVADIGREGGKATRAACLDVLNERREAMGMKRWSRATFKNLTLRGGKLRFRVDPTSNALVELSDEKLQAEQELRLEVGTVLDTP